MFKNENQHPFYKPLWRRVAIVVVVAAWLGFELWQGSDAIWVAIAGGMLVYAVYTFFITWPKDDGKSGA
jgi:uncharacterized membrane protein